MMRRIRASTAQTRSALSVTHRLRIHAIPLSDDDGGRAFAFTEQDLADIVAKANTCLAHAGVELLFDPSCDWAPRRDTSLNNLQNSGSSWWTLGNSVAERIPGKIVMFFRHGPGKDPTGNGHAYPPATGHPVPPSVSLPTDNVRYVAFPNTKTGINQGDGNFFAHEVGHYLGLFHTFPGWGSQLVYGPNPGMLSGVQAQEALTTYAINNGGSETALDGDLLSDTAPDCGVTIYDALGLSHTAAGPTDISISGQLGPVSYEYTFTPPRDNVMSYFGWGQPQRLTAHQRKRIHETLAHDHRRILIEQPCYPDFHGLAANRFQLCFDYWVNRCLWPQTLCATVTAGSLRMAGSFQPGENRPVRHLITGSAYQQAFETFRDQGFRPSRVTATKTSSGTRFTAIWTPIEGQFEARHGLTLNSFNDMWHDMRNAGWLNTDLHIYEAGSGLRAAAVWVKKSWEDYATYFGMTSGQYQQRFKEFWDKGLRVTCFCAYRVGGGYRYAAIWEKVPGAWGHWYGMTSSGYQKKYDEMAATGHRLHQIQAYGTRFSAIWTK